MACNLDHANAGNAFLFCPPVTIVTQQGAAMANTFPPHLASVLPQHSPAPHPLSAVPGMTALAAGDSQLLGAGQLHHQQQLAIASLAAAAGGVAGNKKRQRDSSEEMLLVQTKHGSKQFLLLNHIITTHIIIQKSCPAIKHFPSYIERLSCYDADRRKIVLAQCLLLELTLF